MDIFVSFQAASSPETNSLVRALRQSMSDGRRCKLALRVDFDIHDPALNCGFDSLLKKRIENAKCILAVISREFDDQYHTWIDSLRTSLVDWTPTSRLIGCIGAFSLPELNDSIWSLRFKGHTIRQSKQSTSISNNGHQARAASRSISILDQARLLFSPSRPSAGSRSIGFAGLKSPGSSPNRTESRFSDSSRRFKEAFHPLAYSRNRASLAKVPTGKLPAPDHIDQLHLDELDWQSWDCTVEGRVFNKSAAIPTPKSVKTSKSGEQISIQRKSSKMSFEKPSARLPTTFEQSQGARTLEDNAKSAAKDSLRVKRRKSCGGPLSRPAQKDADPSDEDADLTWTNQVSLRGFDRLLDELADDLEPDEDEPAEVRSPARIKK